MLRKRGVYWRYFDLRIEEKLILYKFGCVFFFVLVFKRAN